MGFFKVTNLEKSQLDWQLNSSVCNYKAERARPQFNISQLAFLPREILHFSQKALWNLIRSCIVKCKKQSVLPREILEFRFFSVNLKSREMEKAVAKHTNFVVNNDHRPHYSNSHGKQPQVYIIYILTCQNSEPKILIKC